MAVPGAVAGYVVGGALALVAAFMPIAARVYPVPSVHARIDAVRAAPDAWMWHNLLFAMGAAMTAWGALVDALVTRFIGAWAAAVLIGVGALLWVDLVMERGSTPAFVWFHAKRGGFRFVAFTLLTILGLVAAALTLAGRWGVAVGALAMVSLVWFVAKRDLPPFVHYVGFVVLGVGQVVSG